MYDWDRIMTYSIRVIFFIDVVTTETCHICCFFTYSYFFLLQTLLNLGKAGPSVTFF